MGMRQDETKTRQSRLYRTLITPHAFNSSPDSTVNQPTNLTSTNVTNLSINEVITLCAAVLLGLLGAVDGVVLAIGTALCLA